MSLRDKFFDYLNREPPTSKAESPLNSLGLGHASTLARVGDMERKFTQQEVRYVQPSPAPYSVCGTCVFYQRGDGETGKCRVVEGDIHWSGTSDLYISAAQEADLSYRQEFGRGGDEPEVARFADDKKKKKRVYAGDNAEEVEKKVVSRDGKFCVTSEDGSRSFGCYSSREAANRRLGQIEGFKKKEAAEDELLVEFLEEDFNGGCLTCGYSDEDAVIKTVDCPYCLNPTFTTDSEEV